MRPTLTPRRFFARARITLVKLQTQISECINDSLQQAVGFFGEQLDLIRPRAPDGSTQHAPGSVQQQAKAGSVAGTALNKKSLGYPELDHLADLVS